MCPGILAYTGWASQKDFMFKVTVIALGKFKEAAFKDLEREYLKRLGPFAKVSVVELPEEPYGKNADLERLREKEAQAIQKHLPKDGMVILLEEKGQLRSSQDFAKFVERVTSLGKELVFVIGSGIGLAASLKEHSNYSVSLSPLTFPHNFARVLLLEQLYRACTITAGKDYHK